MFRSRKRSFRENSSASSPHTPSQTAATAAAASTKSSSAQGSRFRPLRGAPFFGSFFRPEVFFSSAVAMVKTEMNLFFFS